MEKKAVVGSTGRRNAGGEYSPLAQMLHHAGGKVGIFCQCPILLVK
jgi:hypothetical protein